ncbi:MAG: hypothetical protein Q7T73_13095 [Beijerinckiaceae bacterium]|nr:hypothetical protein [Beijerinckiaceae bacterium]
MAEFKHMRVQGFFQPHNGAPANMFDIDPASFKITNEYAFLDQNGGVLGRQRTEMTIEHGKTVVHSVLDDGTRLRWTDPEDLVHASLDALAEAHGYDMPGWTADELAIDVAMSAPALDGRDPQDLEPACAVWLQQRRQG